jgi:hypothetical protein
MKQVVNGINIVYGWAVHSTIINRWRLNIFLMMEYKIAPKSERRGAELAFNTRRKIVHTLSTWH